MLKWFVSGILVILIGLTVCCFILSKAAQNVVSAVDGPPVLRASVDFSKPFTNDFTFRHTVRPFLGTMHLTLEGDPWPSEWRTLDFLPDALRETEGEMFLYGENNNVPIRSRSLDWHYAPGAIEPKGAPVQMFFGSFPLGEYRFTIKTKAGVPELASVNQKLVLRYDLIKERSLAPVFSGFSVVFGIGALFMAGALAWLVKQGGSRPRPSD
jgi:hypothetical protein